MMVLDLDSGVRCEARAKRWWAVPGQTPGSGIHGHGGMGGAEDSGLRKLYWRFFENTVSRVTCFDIYRAVSRRCGAVLGSPVSPQIQ